MFLEIDLPVLYWAGGYATVGAVFAIVVLIAGVKWILTFLRGDA
jgi:hypothetical protein